MYQPSPASPVELLKRQLFDWQQFYADLTLKPETVATDLAYVQQKIDQLTEEIAQYSSSEE